MVKLPIWVMNQNKPAIYDSESATAIEMVAKVYGAMQELIKEYNEFVKSCNTKINEFESASVEEYNVFKTALRQEFQDFIDVIDLKYNSLGVDIEKLQSDVAEQVERINTTVNTGIETINDAIGDAVDVVLGDAALKTKANLFDPGDSFYSMDLAYQKDGYELIDIPLSKGAKLKKQITIENLSESVRMELVSITVGGLEWMLNNVKIPVGGSFTFVVPTTDTGNFEDCWQNSDVATLKHGDTDSYFEYQIRVPNVIDVEDCYKLIQELQNA